MRACLVVLACLTSGCIEGKTRPADGALERVSSVDQRGDIGGSAAWVTIEPGTFLMGPRVGTLCYNYKAPQRTVTLTRRFQIGATEVTREEFAALIGYDPADSTARKACPTNCPVIALWHEAAAYCNALSEKSGLPRCYQCAGAKTTLTCMLDPQYMPTAQRAIYDCPGYRLPTEAEWEYAYRAGSQTDVYSGNFTAPTPESCNTPDPATNLIAWHCAYDGDYVHPVGKKQPNSWGLHDMSGNTWEWCDEGYKADLGSGAVTDPWTPGPVNSLYTQRGGDYYSSPCGVAPQARRSRLMREWAGLRCVRTLP